MRVRYRTRPTSADPIRKLHVMLSVHLSRLIRLAFALLPCFGIQPLMSEPVTVTQGKDTIEIIIGGKPFTTYYFTRDVAKPYLMPLRTAQGTIVTRGFPNGNDIGGLNPKTPSFEPHQPPL